MDTDLVTQVLAACDRTPDATAIVGARGATMTYRRLRERTLAVRDRLAAAGLRRGDGVLYAVRPSPEGVAVALGTVAAGGVLVLADPGLAPGVLRARLRLARPRWVVAESVLYALTTIAPLRALTRRTGVLLPDLRDPLPGSPLRHAYTGRWVPGVPRGAVRLRGTPAPSSPAPPGAASPDTARTDTARTDTAHPGAASIDAASIGAAPIGAAPIGAASPVEAGPGALDAPGLDEAAAVIFTSGTTASPRAVVHTHRSLAAGLEIFRGRVPMAAGDVVHTDGLMLGLPALVGGATWSMPADDPGLIARRGVTHLYAVPVELARLVDRVGRFPDGVRHVLLGSAPAPPGVLRAAVAAAPSAEVLSVYAMTEMLPIALAGAAEKLAHPDGDLLGAPLPGVRARVTDDGELVVGGPHLARGYLGEPPRDEVATGDLARIDDDGRIVLLGRRKDMILRDGVNIYPGLYEPAIARLPGVAEAAIVGLADPRTGDEEVVLAVVAPEGLDAQRLRARLPDVVDAGALPDRIVVVAGFPRTPRRKLDRAALREIVRR